MEPETWFAMSFFEQRATIRIEKRKLAAAQLEAAKELPIKFTIRANVAYKITEDDAPPLDGQAIPFNVKDILAIHDVYDKRWWIGRMVGPNTEFGFIPSVIKMQNLNYDRYRLNKPPKKVIEIQNPFPSGPPKLIDPYDIIPNIRPIVFVGPALKGYEVTDLMHAAIFDYINTRFPGRTAIFRTSNKLNLNKNGALNNPATKALLEEYGAIAPDQNISMSPTLQKLLILKCKFAKINTALMKKIEVDLSQIYELTRPADKLVILDYVIINHPDEMENSPLAPLFIYVPIKEEEILSDLIEGRGPDQFKDLEPQLAAADKLIRCDPDKFHLILDNCQLDDATKKLTNWLEEYWTITHFGYIPPPPELVISDEEAILAAMACAAFVETDPDVIEYRDKRGETGAMLDDLIGKIDEDLEGNVLIEGINKNVIGYNEEIDGYLDKKGDFVEKNKLANMTEEEKKAYEEQKAKAASKKKSLF